jgi:hypothetical protein
MTDVIDISIEEYKMWLDELAARERSFDNYRTADLIMEGKPVLEAAELVATARRLTCSNNQTAILEAETVTKRIMVIRDILCELWTALARRPESVVPRIMYAQTRPADDVVTTAIQEAMNESSTFCQALEDAGVEFTQFPELYSPQNSFVQVEHQRALIEVDRLQKELFALAADSQDDVPELESDKQ